MQTKELIHEIYICIDKAGRVLKMKLSYDEDALLIRSAEIGKPEANFEGKSVMKFQMIKRVTISQW